MDSQEIAELLKKAEDIRQFVSSKREVEVGMLADEVLQIKPRETMTQDPVILETKSDGTYKVKWYYPDMILVIEIASMDQPFPLTAYTVQEIRKL